MDAETILERRRLRRRASFWRVTAFLILIVAIIIGVGSALFFSTLMVFYGVVHLPAIRAIVIMLFELVVGAISSHWLAGESLSMREWIGGILIVAATLFSAFPKRKLR